MKFKLVRTKDIKLKSRYHIIKRNGIDTLVKGGSK